LRDLFFEQPPIDALDFAALEELTDAAIGIESNGLFRVLSEVLAQGKRRIVELTENQGPSL